MAQDSQPAEKRAILPLAYDAERLVATLMSPNASINRRLAAAERLYSLMPSFIWRSLRETAIKLAGNEALMVEKDSEEKTKEYNAKKELLVRVLKGMLKAMDVTREKIVEVKLPPIPTNEELFRGDLPQIIDAVAEALTKWFYSATEEARKKGLPYTEDPSAPGFVPLTTFASLVLVNGLRQLTLIAE